MHELGIAQSIARIVTDQLQGQGVSNRVLRVRLKAGRLNAIIPDSLQFHFDVVKKDYEQLKDAVLEIQQLPAMIHCPACNENYEATEATFVCRKCGGFAAVVSGKELSVDSVEVDD